jgi:Fe2+ transport system protein FeoA
MNTIATLKDLEPGERGKIIKVTAGSVSYRRMLDIGIGKGVEVKVERVAPLGDPIEIVVKGCHISLRKTEAACVKVERLKER